MKRSTGLTEGVNLSIPIKNCPPAVLSNDCKYIRCSNCKSWQGYKTYRRDETYCLLTCKGCRSTYITDDSTVNANHAIKYACARNKKGCRYDSDKYEGTPMNRAARKMFAAAGVECIPYSHTGRQIHIQV